MKILILNQDWFADEWRKAGHEVVTCGIASHLDVVLKMPLLHIDTVFESLPNGFRPDRIVFLDNSSPLMINGIEEKGIPSLFYSVDAHHHIVLHRYLAHLFDATLVAQKDYIPEFEAVGAAPQWMPLWATRNAEPSMHKKYEAVFVGNLDSNLNPDRAKFFEELGKRVKLHCTMGEWWKIFPHAEVVVNQTVKSDLNFRVFEAMICGAPLLTERCGNGLDELFTEGKHYLGYDRNNVEQAADLISQLVNNKSRAASIALEGRSEVLQYHTRQHRADAILNILEELQSVPSPYRNFASLMNFNVLSYRFERIGNTAFTVKVLAEALKSASIGMHNQDKLDDELACHAILASLRYDHLVRTSAGATLVRELSEAYPEISILSYANLRTLLNAGNRTAALTLAQQLSDEDPGTIFERAESLVTELIQRSA